MSHTRRTRVMHELIVNPNGTAELRRAGNSVWMSDDDPDLADDIGSDYVNGSNIGKVLDYLVDIGVLTDAQADACYVSEPDTNPTDNSDDDEDNGDDEPLEGEYIPAEEAQQ